MFVLVFVIQCNSAYGMCFCISKGDSLCLLPVVVDVCVCMCEFVFGCLCVGGTLWSEVRCVCVENPLIGQV